MKYVVDGNKAFGQASLRRTNRLVERFRVVAQGVRTFHAQNTQVVLPEQFKGKFVQCFNKDLQEWSEKGSRHAHMLTQEIGMFPGPSDVHPLPPPLSSRTHTLVTAARIYLGDVGYAGEHAAGGHKRGGGAGEGQGGASGRTSGTGAAGGWGGGGGQELGWGVPMSCMAKVCGGCSCHCFP